MKVCASTVNTAEESWHQIQQSASEISNVLGISERLRVSFSYRAELCVDEPF
jgi:hypothetical protein